MAFGVGYDEIYFLKTAIEMEGSAEPKKIMEGLKKVKGFQGVLGEYSMDPNTRRTQKPICLLEVKGGQFSFVDQFYPKYVPDI